MLDTAFCWFVCLLVGCFEVPSLVFLHCAHFPLIYLKPFNISVKSAAAHQDPGPPVKFHGGTSANYRQSERPTSAAVDKCVTSGETKGLQESKAFLLQLLSLVRSSLIRSRQRTVIPAQLFSCSPHWIVSFMLLCLSAGVMACQCVMCFPLHE